MLLIRLAAVAAALDLLALGLGWHAVRAFTKPLPAVLLALAVLRTQGSARIVALGLIFAALGDALLLGGGSSAFAAGMGTFAVMQVCYILAFIQMGSGVGRVRRHPWLVLPFAFAVVAISAVLDPQAGTLALPLAIYSALLGAMALCALDASGRMPTRAGLVLAAGALAFVASDTLLASATFVAGFPSGLGVQMGVMLAYFVAQIAIAWGTIATGRALSAS